MANREEKEESASASTQTQPQPAEEDEVEREEEEEDPYYDDSSDSDGTSSYAGGYYSSSDDDEKDNSPERTVRKFTEALESRSLKKKEEQEERNCVDPEDLFDFPRDPEKWREEDLQELWADGPIESSKPGWDPVWADEEDWEIVKEEVKAGRDPPIAPFYLPYRQYYPVIPDNHHDISTPKSVIEELDRIEEFLKWVSFVFADGST